MCKSSLRRNLMNQHRYQGQIQNFKKRGKGISWKCINILNYDQLELLFTCDLTPWAQPRVMCIPSQIHSSNRKDRMGGGEGSWCTRHEQTFGGTLQKLTIIHFTMYIFSNVVFLNLMSVPTTLVNSYFETNYATTSQLTS